MMTRLVGVAALTATLAACSMSLAPEQSAKLDREYRPVVNAFIPACIATASGRKADYSAIKALGYVQRDAMFGTGDYLYPSNKSLMSNNGIRFVPGEGCHSNYDGVPNVALGGLDEVGQVWVRALESVGYRNTGGSSSSFNFMADGVMMSFRGTFSSQNGLSFSITRAD